MDTKKKEKNSLSRIIDQHVCISSYLQCGVSIVFLCEGSVKVKRKSCVLSRSYGLPTYWGLMLIKTVKSTLG